MQDRVWKASENRQHAAEHNMMIKANWAGSKSDIPGDANTAWWYIDDEKVYLHRVCGKIPDDDIPNNG